jgi:hypothetical protein
MFSSLQQPFTSTANNRCRKNHTFIPITTTSIQLTPSELSLPRFFGIHPQLFYTSSPSISSTLLSFPKTFNLSYRCPVVISTFLRVNAITRQQRQRQRTCPLRLLRRDLGKEFSLQATLWKESLGIFERKLLVALRR